VKAEDWTFSWSSSIGQSGTKAKTVSGSTPTQLELPVEESDPVHTSDEGTSATYIGERDPALVVAAEQFGYCQPAKRTLNRRRNPRVSCRECRGAIRSADGEIIRVFVLNVSKSGACVETMQPLTLGSVLEIATSYIEGGNNVFVPARVVRPHRKPGLMRAQYGIEFTSLR
jgi:hypothetical protein